MPVAVEAEVKEVLTTHEARLYAVVRGAWHDDWLSSPHRSQIRFPRTRANLVHEFMVRRAIAEFDGDPEVKVFIRDETAKFLFRDRVLVRFKKANVNGLGANIETQAVLAFVDPQLTLPGIPGDVQKIEICYLLDDLQTRIDHVVVSARDGDTRLWSYHLNDQRADVVLPLPQPIAPAGDGAVVRLRNRSNNRADTERG